MVTTHGLMLVACIVTGSVLHRQPQTSRLSKGAQDLIATNACTAKLVTQVPLWPAWENGLLMVWAQWTLHVCEYTWL